MPIRHSRPSVKHVLILHAHWRNTFPIKQNGFFHYPRRPPFPNKTTGCLDETSSQLMSTLSWSRLTILTIIIQEVSERRRDGVLSALSSNLFLVTSTVSRLAVSQPTTRQQQHHREREQEQATGCTQSSTLLFCISLLTGWRNIAQVGDPPTKCQGYIVVQFIVKRKDYPIRLVWPLINILLTSEFSSIILLQLLSDISGAEFLAKWNPPTKLDSLVKRANRGIIFN